MTCEIVILALDLSPLRLRFLNELLNTLKLRTNLPITMIGDVDALPRVLPDAKTRRPEDVLGFELPSDLPSWYHEQLLALAYAASNISSFSLILPVGSFVLRSLDEADLLPRTMARTHWESVDLHPDWWKVSAELTRRRRFSEWEGSSILPALLSRELAQWTLDIVRRENGRPALDVLIDAVRSGRHWSAMTLYATASGSRFSKFHLDSFDSRSYPLLTRSLVWNQEQGERFGDPDGKGPDIGLITYVQVSEIQNPEPVLERLRQKASGSEAKSSSRRRGVFGKLWTGFPLIGGR